jgi:hypothetical protein
VRPLKENPLWVGPFHNIEELGQSLLEFKRIYNESWIIQRQGYKTPPKPGGNNLRRCP